MLGDSVYRYDPAHYLLATVGLPVVGQVLEASAERPYLSRTSGSSGSPPCGTWNGCARRRGGRLLFYQACSCDSWGFYIDHCP